MLKHVLVIGELSDTCKSALDMAVQGGLISEYSLYDSDKDTNLDSNYILMKGYIHSEDFLRTVISIAKSICARDNLPKPLLIHCAVLKNNDKQFILSDAVCVPQPDDAQRKNIIRSAAKLCFQMNPGKQICNVSLLCAGGDTNAKANPELYSWWANNKNEFGADKIDLRLEQLDVALNAYIRSFKGVDGETADVVVCPDINMGNCIWKCLTTLTTGWLCAGLLTGAPIPVILNSRGDSAESMLYSIRVATSLK